MSEPPRSIVSLLIEVRPISPVTSIAEAADLLLGNEYDRLLCLPIVSNGSVVGVLSRNQLNQIFMHRYGRELYGRRPVSSVMNREPLVVRIDDSLEDAAAYVGASSGNVQKVS